MSKFKLFFANRKSQVLSSVLTALLLPLIIFVSIPIEVFGNNLSEFTFSAVDFVPMSILLAFLFALLIFAILFSLPQKANRIVSFIILFLAIMCYLQGTYLNSGANSLGGDNMGEGVSTLSIVVNTIIWVVLGAALIVLACFENEKRSWIKYVAYVLTAIVFATQLVTIIVSMTRENFFLERSERIAIEDVSNQDKNLSTKNLTTLSTSNNILYFCVDRFDEQYAIQAYEADPTIFDNLDGFTWFRDNISWYGHTFPGISSMLTGQKFDMDKQRREDFLASAYKTEGPLAELKNNGYSVNLYTQPYYAYSSYLPEYVDNYVVGKYETNNKMRLACKMALISVSRVSPLFLKKYIGRSVNSDTCNSEVSFFDEYGNKGHSTDNRKIWQLINEMNFSTQDKKMFSFIHMEGCHNIDYNENFEKANLHESKNIVNSVKTSFKIINKYITALKENGLYDKTTIIITGDHAAPYNDYSDISEVRQTALFFKPVSTTGALETSDAQVCQENIWPSIFKDQSIPYSSTTAKALNEIAEGENQERTFVWQTYEKFQTKQYKYVINGDGSDLSNWTKVEEKKYDHFVMD